MQDYEKLTVVKLRDELVARGLPKTGLKAALVQRLIDADEQPKDAESAAKDSSKSSQEDESVTKAVLSGLQALTEPKDDHHSADDAPQSGEQDNGRLKVSDEPDEDVPHHEPDELARAESLAEEMREYERPEEQASNSLPEPSGYVLTPKATQSEHFPEHPDENAIKPGLQLPTPVQTQAAEMQAVENIPGISTQTSLTGDEFLEDSRKRKRRSQTPPPSSMENTQKRLKADDGRPHVELPEDSMVGHADSEARPDGLSSRSDSTCAQESTSKTDGHTCTNGESRVTPINTFATVEQKRSSHSQTDSPALEEMGSPREGYATPTEVKSVESPTKPSPSDARFKSLFTAPASLEPASQEPSYPDAEDKIISPALHPATSALYIRELMRPLKIESLRDHLIALATPPGTVVNPDILTDFFLDSVRTHCLVGFASISAASRVRSGLHDRVWPNERDRRQLWVDFVPEEKLRKWIDVEQAAGNGRGQPSKRWEVVYEDEQNGIQACLQEAGPNSGGLRAAQSSRVDAGQGGQVAPPSGPRISALGPRSTQSRPDSGKGFRALDDLFTSTAAKPKLYYLPVSKAEANRRLVKLAAGRGGGRGDEMRRFSFEEGSIVDNGPEFGRGGYGRGGAHLGSYWGRARGYRGDASRGDSWRDRR